VSSPSRMAIWLPGLFVAIAAAVATAHGLFEVAVASGVPGVIAWLYPLITDGLALVAYASTTRLDGPAGRYAWTVVVIAAGLSGLAQACYLGGGVGAVAAAQLRFGVGAWPAVAAAIVAHLLYLLVASNPVQRLNVRLDTDVRMDPGRPTEPAEAGFGSTQAEPEPFTVERPDGGVPTLESKSVQRLDSPSDAPARDRAQAAAQRHAARHGRLPTVSQLMTLADVSRGTAGDALKALRNRPTPLQLVSPDENNRTKP
jgi:hypothetical protein